MSLTDRLAHHVCTFGRRASSGEVAVSFPCIDLLPGVVGWRRKLTTPKFMQLISGFLIRKTEYSLQVIARSLQYMDVVMSDDDWSGVQKLLDEHLPMPMPLPPPVANMPPPELAENQIVAAAAPAAEAAVVEHVEADAYASYSREQLIATLHRRDKAIKSAKKRNKNGLRVISRRNKQIAVYADTKPTADVLAITRTAKGRLTKSSIYSLAIRRNMSNIASGDLGTVLLEPILRQTVVRAELHAAAALQASAVSYWAVEAKLANSDDNKYGLTVLAVTADATGAGMWQKKKLSTCIVDAEFLMDTGHGLEPVPIKRHCDIVPVVDSSGRGTYAVMENHLKSIGAPSWTLNPTNSRYVRTWVHTTDRGPDEISVRKMISSQVKALENVIYIPNDCVEHCLHLIVKAVLTMADKCLEHAKKPYKYFPSLTKICQIWRDRAQQVFQQWAAKYGRKSAQACCANLCPKCIAGRWGSVATTEKRLEDVEIERLHCVLKDVLGVSAMQDKQKKNKSPDDVQMDDIKAYREKMSKWSGDALTATGDKFFRCMVTTTHEATKPTIHASNLIKKLVPQHEVDTRGSQMAIFISEYAAKIASEYDELLVSTVWHLATVDLPQKEAETLRSYALKLILLNASAFDRRLHKKVKSFPLKALRIGEADANTACQVTMGICDYIMSTPEKISTTPASS